ncbi:MAG: hypothetical protein SP1CHLAM54_12070 [Chlamydiia bacterium]|nr:hypothetical protein [Chlamydiia bacterium]MCH9616105.1 hypothetical protein [Chlamydiia bacterium]MCH9629472.1 hypothetical protein [Chlamydiia bacterium]
MPQSLQPHLESLHHDVDIAKASINNSDLPPSEKQELTHRVDACLSHISHIPTHGEPSMADGVTIAEASSRLSDVLTELWGKLIVTD